jgi:hypothetical protein
MASYVMESTKVTDRHSRLGISSFVLAILLGILAFSSVVAAGVLVSSGMGADDVAMQLVGLAIIGGLLANVVGLGLGVAGLIQRSRKKLFAILGAIGNGLVILIVLSLMVAGSSA